MTKMMMMTDGDPTAWVALQENGMYAYGLEDQRDPLVTGFPTRVSAVEHAMSHDFYVLETPEEG